MNFSTNIFEICSISQLEWRCFEARHCRVSAQLQAENEEEEEGGAVKAGARVLESQRKLCTVTPSIPLHHQHVERLRQSYKENKRHDDIAFFFQGDPSLPRLWVFSVNGKDSIPDSIDGLQEVGMGQVQMTELKSISWQMNIEHLSAEAVGQYLVVSLMMGSLSKLVEPMLAPLGLVHEQGFLLFQQHRNHLFSSAASREQGNSSTRNQSENTAKKPNSVGRTDDSWAPACRLNWVMEGNHRLQVNVLTTSVRRKTGETDVFASVRRSVSALASLSSESTSPTSTSTLIDWQSIPQKKPKAEDASRVVGPSVTSVAGKKRPRSLSKDSKSGSRSSYPDTVKQEEGNSSPSSLSLSHSAEEGKRASPFSINRPTAPPSAFLDLQAAVDEYSKEKESPTEVWSPSVLLPDEFSPRPLLGIAETSSSALHSLYTGSRMRRRRRLSQEEEVSFSHYSAVPSLPWLHSELHQHTDSSLASTYYEQVHERAESPSHSRESETGSLTRPENEREEETADRCNPEDIAWALLLWKQMLLVPWSSVDQVAGCGPTLDFSTASQSPEGDMEEVGEGIETRPATLDERDAFLSLVVPIMKALRRLLSLSDGKETTSGGVSLLTLQDFADRPISGGSKDEGRPSSTIGRRSARGEKEQMSKSNGKAAKGYLESLNMPHLLVSFQEDSISVPASVLPSWDYSQLKPYSSTKRVEYIALCPFNTQLPSALRSLLREVSCAYQNCSLGSHSPLSLASEGIPIQRTLAGQTWLSSSTSSSEGQRGEKASLVQPLRFSEDDAILLLSPSEGPEASVTSPYYEGCKALRSILWNKKKQASVFDQPLLAIVVYVVSPFLGPLSSAENCGLLSDLARGLWEQSLAVEGERGSVGSGEKVSSSSLRSPHSLKRSSTPPLSASTSRLDRICSLAPFDSDCTVNIIFHVLDAERVSLRTSLAASAKDIAFSVYSKTLVPKLLVQKSEVQVNATAKSWISSYEKSLLHGKNYLAFQPLSVVASPTTRHLVPPPPHSGAEGSQSPSRLAQSEEGGELTLHGCYDIVDDGKWLVFAWTDCYGEVFTVNAFPSSELREGPPQRAGGGWRDSNEAVGGEVEKNGEGKDNVTAIAVACRVVYAYGLQLLRLLGPTVGSLVVAKLGRMSAVEVKEWRQLLLAAPVPSRSLLTLTRKHSLQITGSRSPSSRETEGSGSAKSPRSGGVGERSSSSSSSVVGSSVLCIPRSRVAPVLSQPYEGGGGLGMRTIPRRRRLSSCLQVESAAGLIVQIPQPVPGGWKAEGLGCPLIEDMIVSPVQEDESTVEVHLLSHWRHSEEIELPRSDKDLASSKRSDLHSIMRQLHDLSFLTASPADLRRRSCFPIHAHAVEQLRVMLNSQSCHKIRRPSRAATGDS